MGEDNAEGPKNYLRTTIAMQQHSVKRMNKELLRYSLQQPRKYKAIITSNFFFYFNRRHRTEPYNRWSSTDRRRRLEVQDPIEYWIHVWKNSLKGKDITSNKSILKQKLDR